MIIEWLRGIFASRSSNSETLHECRHCGEGVEPSTDVCPACGHAGIATYELR